MKRVVVMAVMALACVACSGVDDGASWLAQVTDASARADLLSARPGGRASAMHELEAALALPVPDEVAAADRRAVRQDLWFRVSRLALGGRDDRRALASAEQGLAEGEADDVFFANLLVARGRAREALGRDHEASDDYYRALVLNEKLMNAALRGR